MSEAQFIILYLIVGAIIVLGIVWLIKANRRRGVKGERVVAGILRRYTLFQKSLGMSPQQFLAAYRLTKAAEMLMVPHLPVESIALSS